MKSKVIIKQPKQNIKQPKLKIMKKQPKNCLTQVIPILQNTLKCLTNQPPTFSFCMVLAVFFDVNLFTDDIMNRKKVHKLSSQKSQHSSKFPFQYKMFIA